MSYFNTATTYGVVAKFFHWLIALLVIVMLCVGFTLDSIPKESRGFVINIHKLTGLTILLLVLLRLGWSLINTKPMLIVTVWEKLAERTVHGLLYAALIAMPLLGWVGSSAGGRFPHIGSVQFALPVPQDKALKDWAFEWHGIIGWTIVVLVCIHVLAALYHHFIRRDDVLRRMLPKGWV